jgi:hypothetical protein
VSSTRYSCYILMKFESSLKMFEKSSNIKFYEKPPNGSPVVSCRQTDEYENANKRFSRFFERPKNGYFKIPISQIRVICNACHWDADCSVGSSRLLSVRNNNSNNGSDLTQCCRKSSVMTYAERFSETHKYPGLSSRICPATQIRTFKK